METIRGLKNLKLKEKRSVITIGVFDGVHKGHQRIISAAVKEAHKRQALSVVITFQPHPKEILKPGSHPPILTTTNFKAELIKKLGADFLVIVPFSKEIAQLSPEQFVRQVLLSALKVECIVVGENFKFGKNAEGKVKLLKDCGKRYGFDVVSVASVKVRGKVVSSTLIRQLLKAGDIEGVKEGLGRLPRIAGKVVKGHSRGRELGFPTANIEAFDKAVVPKTGVYAGLANVHGEKRLCVIDIGVSPTFGGGKEIIHIHVVNFNEDIYQENLEVEIIARIRDERSFPDHTSLARQISKDIQTAQKTLQNTNLK